MKSKANNFTHTVVFKRRSRFDSTPTIAILLLSNSNLITEVDKPVNDINKLIPDTVITISIFFCYY